MMTLSKAMDLSNGAPPASDDLFHEVSSRSTLLACRSVTDSMQHEALRAIKSELPSHIVLLTKLMKRAEEDETWLFHERQDSQWVEDGEVVQEVGSDSEGSEGEAVVRAERSISAELPQQRRRKCDPFRAPQVVVERYTFIQPLIKDILRLFDLVQLYIICKTPAVEEGNNTGVEVQQSCLRTLNDARRYVIGLQAYPKHYHSQRAKLASKVLKYPGLEDYQRAVVERDAEECRDLRYLFNRLRVQVLCVVSFAHSNWTKIDQPKGAASGGIGMY